MMMKQITLFIVLVLLFPAVLMSKPVDKDTARQKALSFVVERWPSMARGSAGGGMGRGLQSSAVERSLTLALSCEGYHVFNVARDWQSQASGGGFVIVSGDDRIADILGYSDSGTFSTQDMPDNVRAWLQGYADQIAWMRANDADGGPQAARAASGVTAKSPIAPLIKTKWNQGSPIEGGYIYNTMCPEIDGKRCHAGCVPTAGAQLMYYYQHPKDSIGEIPGYESDLAVTSKPLPATRLKWELMKTEYTKDDEGTESAEAVAELMLYCGYMAQASYGLSGTGASSGTMARGMAEHFGYDANTIKGVSRISYTVSDWDALIYGELQQGRPVLYGGSSDKSGHAFICDGYDGNGLYHFNWGWGGGYDGYFTLQATNPYTVNRMDDYGYIFSQSALIGLQPDTGMIPDDPSANDEPAEEPVTEGILATVSNLRVEGTVIIMRGSNNNDVACGFGFGIAELMSDGTLMPVDTSYVYYKNTILAPNYGFSNIRYDLANCNLTEGQHTIVAICKLNDGDGTWQRCKYTSSYFQVDVAADGIMAIVAHPIESIRVERFEVVSPCMPFTAQNVAVRVTNEGDFYEKGLAIYLGTEESVGNYAAYKKVAIAPGNTKEYTFSVDKRDDDYKSVLAPGDYVLRLCVYGRTETVLAQTSMKIEQSLELDSIELTGNRLIQSVQPIVAKVRSRAGDYTKPLYLFASQTDAMGECVYKAGAAIEGGQTGDVVFYFAPKTEGEWNLWVAADEEGKDVIGHQTVTFVSLNKTLVVNGCKFANVRHNVVLSVDNPGGEYSETLSLFASTTDEKGSRKSYKQAVFKANDTSEATFTFTPREAGKWNVWLCSDWKGENVVAQTEIVIRESPEGRVKMKEVAAGVTYKADSVCINVTMENIGDVTNYRELFARLIEADTIITRYYSDPITIEPGQTGSTAVKFGNLQKGRQYTVRYFYFIDCAGTYITTMGSQDVMLPEGPHGDVNGDGKVDVADIASIIDVMAGSAGDSPASADVNGDGIVDVADIAVVIDLMADGK